jgi:hypothetical protein
MKRISIVVAVGVVALSAVLLWRVVLRDACPPNGAMLTFNAVRWSSAPGACRIAMARDVVGKKRLLGKKLPDAESLLGAVQTAPNGRSGWLLGFPDESPSLYPNAKWLVVTLGDHDAIIDAAVVDDE